MKKRKFRKVIICVLLVGLASVITLLLLLILRPELAEKLRAPRDDNSIKEEGSQIKGWSDIVEWDWKGKRADGSVTEAGFDSDEVRKAAAEGYMKAAKAFAEHLEQSGHGASEDARFGLFDIDSDGVPELIMHDLMGEYACFCTCRDGGVTERSVLYDNLDGESSFKSCALFPDRNLMLIYEISGGSSDDPYRQSIKTDICELDVKGEQVLLDSILMEIIAGDAKIDTHFKHLIEGAEEEIDSEDYYSLLADYAGADIVQRFRVDNGMTDIIEGEYDFGVGRSEAGTRRLQRLTLEELGEALDDIKGG